MASPRFRFTNMSPLAGRVLREIRWNTFQMNFGLFGSRFQMDRHWQAGYVSVPDALHNKRSNQP